MDIQVKTKFNIGQEVYVCNQTRHFIMGEYKTKFIPMNIPLVITQIMICVDAKHSSVQYHLFGNNNIKYSYSENLLFDSFEDVTEWCNKQNKLHE